MGRFQLTAIMLAIFVHGPAIGGDGITYKYEEDDGTVWFTDRKPNADRLDEFRFMGYHGRPPARASCSGTGDDALAQRQARIETPVRQLADRYATDHLLIKAIIAVESCFDPKAVSRVGARGLMQLMPYTAKAVGVEDSFDIQENLRGGIEYFSRMHERYDGNTAFALAAYNAGPNAVDRHDGIPPYPETRRYVRRVLEHWREYRDGINGTDSDQPGCRRPEIASVTRARVAVHRLAPSSVGDFILASSGSRSA
ncbi:MAG: lytic transglycosylase domain-containing protein [Halofilum sp. (in: g-proteobacteria)]|nr:lytic transglycosylase domain-containing protein [Halofilum sp. (in: g-proteobacteria)]